MQVTYVAVVRDRPELDLEGDQSAVITNHDKVDLVVPAGGAQMTGSCVRGIGVRAHAQGDQALEQGAQEGAVPWHGRTVRIRTVEQGTSAHAEKTRCQGWIGQLVLGRLAQGGER